MEKTDSLKTPVLFLIFNRPEPTRRVFEQIRLAKPRRLFIAADGPRAHKEGEAQRCQEVRDIVSQVDWECDVKTLFREQNLGCKMAVSSAIDWFFDQVEQGIILEDDCLPSQSFFTFTSELLDKYANDERIMMISGDNFQEGVQRGDGSYYFSKYPHIWGWASWRRAWSKHYDIEMKTFPQYKAENRIAKLFPNPREQKFWMNNFQEVFDNKVDTWDFQWVYAIYSNGGMCIMPNVNMISNIGFNAEATHTKTGGEGSANLQTQEMSHLVHPSKIEIDKAADKFESQHVFHIPTKGTVIKSKLKSLLKKVL